MRSGRPSGGVDPVGTVYRRPPASGGMAFLDEGHLLETEAARRLHEEIRDLPIVDPHDHVHLAEALENEPYSDVWEVGGASDHYVWQLVRKRGVPERKITGDATDRENTPALAGVFPDFAGSPTYEWIHLDPKRRFGIDEPLNADTDDGIWERTPLGRFGTVEEVAECARLLASRDNVVTGEVLYADGGWQAYGRGAGQQWGDDGPETPNAGSQVGVPQLFVG